MIFIVICVVLALLAPANSHGLHDEPTPTEYFERKRALDHDGKFWVFWKFNETHVTFETHTETLGYVGFGISMSGGMFPADIIVAWIKDGVTYFKDCHTSGKFAPIVDDSQDWHLLFGKEENANTILKFTRKRNTCDKDDFAITDDTVRLIYAYHPDDPESFTSIPYHGHGRRGTHSELILSSTLSDRASGFPEDTSYTDFLNKNYLIPAVETTYRCTVFQIPKMNKKHHVIKTEGVIEEGHEPYVHHMLLYHCKDLDPKWNNFTYMCYEKELVPLDLQSCRAVYAAWEIGGEAFYYPPIAGMSIGDENDPTWFILETHYNNPGQVHGIVDKSGIRITYTPTLRQVDAGMLEGGFFVDPSQIIPPYLPSFTSKGICTEQDFARGVPESGINVFAVMQHAHLIARKMKTRHFRNGKELTPLAQDDFYDFNFQEFRFLKEERQMYKGDSFTIECTYDSRSRNKTTTGGLSTFEEMCVVFLLYYPKMRLDNCWSQMVYEEVHPNTIEAQRQINSWNFKDQSIMDRFLHIADTTLFNYSSFGNDLSEGWMYHTGREPKPLHVYIPPEDNSCSLTHYSQSQPGDGNAASFVTFSCKLYLLVFMCICSKISWGIC